MSKDSEMKVTRRRLTHKERLAAFDERIATHEAALEKVKAERAAYVSEHKAVAEAALADLGE